MKKILLLAAAILMTLVMSSCTVNKKSDLDFLWWLFLIVLTIVAVLIFVGTNDKDRKEAERRGMSVMQYLDEEIRREERNTMAKGIDVEYLGGIPNWPEPCRINFSIVSKSVRLKKSRSEIFKIPKEDIISISNEKSSRRSVGSTVVGAIAGGIISGGIGALVGGVVGTRSKDTSEVYIDYLYDDTDLTIHLKTGKNTDKIYAWINSVFA